MRWWSAARAALVASVVAGSASAATAAPTPHPAPIAVLTPSSPVSTFRSVRSYADVAVAEPVRLRIPALQVDSPLVHLGVAPDRTIQVPADYGTAGWFADGPRPGQPGPAVILGHIDSKAGPGVFFRLATLPLGADVMVDRADGSTIDFWVRGVQRVPKTAFPTDLVYAPTLQPSLHLVTCGGQFDHKAGSYLDNVIVYADPRP